MKNLLILITFATISCGKVKVELKAPQKPIETEVVITKDYEAVYAFCDERYGYKTDEAEGCASDILNYKVEVALNLNTVAEFCSSAEDFEACEEDLLSFI